MFSIGHLLVFSPFISNSASINSILVEHLEHGLEVSSLFLMTKLLQQTMDDDNEMIASSRNGHYFMSEGTR